MALIKIFIHDLMSPAQLRRLTQNVMGIICFWATIAAVPAQAHDPVFGMGPHSLYKDGYEVAVELHTNKKGAAQETELGLELVYGITGDWAVGLELPYVSGAVSGIGDTKFFTKYRFWRHDTLGAQKAVAVLVQVKPDTGNAGTGTTDTILGLSYGFESRKWYNFASVRYRQNGRNGAALKRGDKWLIDLVGGVRPHLSGYREPDTVWMLELNGEYSGVADIGGSPQANTGGTEWFLSPGVFWTKRNFAVKAGVQIPIMNALNGSQDRTDYRVRLVSEWHL